MALAACPCGVVYQVTDESAGEIREYYESGAYHTSSTRHPGVRSYEDRYAEDVIVGTMRLARYAQLGLPRTAVFLDVGCAAGAFVDAVNTSAEDKRAFPYSAFGVDLDPRFARENGFVCCGSVYDAPPAAFDVVTYHDVLEHVVDPEMELVLARTRLNLNGFLAIEVPDVHAPHEAGHKHYKREHLWYFTLRSLVDLVQRAGLEFKTSWFPIPGKMVVVACKTML